ncbi:MAG: hypothetical protein JRL30_30035, partial [Deltaproteobacteria bacterium]|nr:hypothetical protein [Deltaproteobacteria bacterium]
MEQPVFTEQDLRQIEDHHLTVSAVRSQLALFDSRPFLRLKAPCTIGDGIGI